MIRISFIFAISAILLTAAPSSESQILTERAWVILQQGVANRRAEKRASAVHALGLLPNNARAQEMAENALADQSPAVRAAAARTLGVMQAMSSLPKVKAVLNDREPVVVLAAAHSLFLLGDREAAYEIDYAVLTGERKGANGLVASQMNELKNPKAVARMGIETGIGFVPFGGAGYEAFRRMTKDAVTPVRVAAAQELAMDRDPKVGAALVRACSDKKSRVRAAAVEAIAKREEPALLNAVKLLLNDKSYTVRYDASAAVLRLSAAEPAE